MLRIGIVAALAVLASGCVFDSLADVSEGTVENNVNNQDDMDMQSNDMSDMDIDVDMDPDLPPSQTLTVNVTDDTNDGSCDSNHCSLREAIASANAVEDALVTFDLPAGAEIDTIAVGSTLQVSGNVRIEGYEISENRTVEIRGDFAMGPVFELDSSETIILRDLEVTATNSNAAVRMRGPHQLERVSVRGGGVGILVESGDNVRITDCGLGFSSRREVPFTPGNNMGILVGPMADRVTMTRVTVVSSSEDGVYIGPSTSTDEVLISESNIGSMPNMRTEGGNQRNGIVIQRPNVQVADSIIGNNGLNGIFVAIEAPSMMDAAVAIRGNQIGVAEATSIPNGLSGIDALSANAINIGGPKGDGVQCEQNCNAIGAHPEAGIRLSGVANSQIQGNYIGFSTLRQKRGNEYGITIGASGFLARPSGEPCVIGGDCSTGACLLETNNTNRPGVAGTCRASIGCQACDKRERPVPGVINIGAGSLGTGCTGACNAIGHQTQAGIGIGNAQAVNVTNTLIGVAPTGGASAPNNAGIQTNINGPALLNISESVLSGNTTWGFIGDAVDFQLRNSLIGVGPVNQTPIGNETGGVWVGLNQSGVIADNVFANNVESLRLGAVRLPSVPFTGQVQDNSFSGLPGANESKGIYVVFGQNLGIMQNTFDNFDVGLRLLSGRNVSITQNDMTNTTIGLQGEENALSLDTGHFEASENTFVGVGTTNRAIELAPNRPGQDAGDVDGGFNGLLNYPDNLALANGALTSMSGEVSVQGARIEFVESSGNDIIQTYAGCIDNGVDDDSTGNNLTFDCSLGIQLPTGTTLRAIATARRYAVSVNGLTAGQTYGVRIGTEDVTVVATNGDNNTSLRDKIRTEIENTVGLGAIAVARNCPLTTIPCVDLTVGYDVPVVAISPADVTHVQAETAGNVSSEFSNPVVNQ